MEPRGAKKSAKKEELKQKDLTKNWSGDKKRFLKDKKFIQPMTEPRKSFNKNK